MVTDPITWEPLPTGVVGELAVKGPQVMKGYWNHLEETMQVLRDGWLHTGDMATMDEDGYFTIVDRKKDLIIASGYNVYPREVEEVLYSHPAIQEAAVVGVSSDYRGETVKTVVVLRDGNTVTDAEIVAFCRERLAAYKVPKIVEFRSELPKSLVGKVLRRELREPAAQAELPEVV
jgi:long-chain acyl-CoA synthetase